MPAVAFATPPVPGKTEEDRRAVAACGTAERAAPRSEKGFAPPEPAFELDLTDA
jgi:hypothetical protein